METVPGKPPKRYNKYKSIGIFAFKSHRRCIEMVRGKISSQGDIYVFPHPSTQKEFPFHESFHKTGDFHWTMKDEKTVPVCGPKDLPAAEKAAHFRLRWPPPLCFCFRKGKGLRREEIKLLVENLKRYVPPINVEEVVSSLEEKGFCKMTLSKPPLHQK